MFAAVQRLRRLAQANDKLQTSPQQVVVPQQVTVEAPAGSSQAPAPQEVIVIQPAQADTVYVPTYDPATVYGSSWPYPSYPPLYPVQPPGYYFGAALATGLAFAAGAAVVGGLWGWASPRVGRRLRERQRQSIQQHQCQSAANQLKPLVWGCSFGPASCQRGHPADQWAFRAVGKLTYPAMRCGLRHARVDPAGWAASAVLVGPVVPAAWAVSAALVGRAVPAAWVVSAVLAGRVVPAGWAASAVLVGPVVPAAWAVSAALVGRAVPAAWVVLAVLAGRVVPAGWAVSVALGGRVGPAVWVVPAAPVGRVVLAARAVSAALVDRVVLAARAVLVGRVAQGAPAAGQHSGPAGTQRPGGAFGDMNSAGRQAGQNGTAGCAEPIGRSAATGGRRRRCARWRRRCARRRWWTWRRWTRRAAAVDGGRRSRMQTLKT